jgi:hypothetical protein
LCGNIHTRRDSNTKTVSFFPTLEKYGRKEAEIPGYDVMDFIISRG